MRWTRCCLEYNVKHMNLQFPPSLLPPTPPVFSFKWFRMQWIIRKFLRDLACRVLIRPGQTRQGKSNRNESRPLVPLSKGQIRSTMRAGVAPPPHTHTRIKGHHGQPPSTLSVPHSSCQLASLPTKPSRQNGISSSEEQKNKKVGQNFRFSIFCIHFRLGI